MQRGAWRVRRGRSTPSKQGRRGDRELRGGLEIRVNLLGELRGDSASRAAWYKNMRETGAFSVNEIRAQEDLPPVPGGDTHYASLNYVPLEDFQQLSTTRAESRLSAD